MCCLRAGRIWEGAGVHRVHPQMDRKALVREGHKRSSSSFIKQRQTGDKAGD